MSGCNRFHSALAALLDGVRQVDDKELAEHVSDCQRCRDDAREKFASMVSKGIGKAKNTEICNDGDLKLRYYNGELDENHNLWAAMHFHTKACDYCFMEYLACGGEPKKSTKSPLGIEERVLQKTAADLVERAVGKDKEKPQQFDFYKLACDLGNFLVEISGFAELELHSLPKNSPIRHRLQRISDLAETGSKLARKFIETQRPKDTYQSSSKPEGIILLVDDESPICELAKHIIEAEGFSPIVIKNGLQAANVFEEHAEETDAIIIVTTPEGKTAGGASADEVAEKLGKTIPDDVTLITIKKSLEEGFLPQVHRSLAQVSRLPQKKSE